MIMLQSTHKKMVSDYLDTIAVQEIELDNIVEENNAMLELIEEMLEIGKFGKGGKEKYAAKLKDILHGELNEQGD